MTKHKVVEQEDVQEEAKDVEMENQPDENNPMKEANLAIKRAFYASILSLFFVVSLVSFNSNNTWWSNFFDVFFSIALSFGLYKKSRVASIAIFVYFVSSKIIQLSLWVMSMWWISTVMLVVFVYIYWKWIEWTFLYHKLMKTKKLEVWEILLWVGAWLMQLLAIIWAVLMLSK